MNETTITLSVSGDNYGSHEMFKSKQEVITRLDEIIDDQTIEVVVIKKTKQSECLVNEV